MAIRDSIVDILRQAGVEWKETYDNLEWDATGVDSFLFIKLIAEVEEKFGLKFEDEDLDLKLYRSMDDFIKKTQQYVKKDLHN